MTALRIALAQYPIERVAGVDGFAKKLRGLAAEAAAMGAQWLVLPEYAATEVAGSLVSAPDVMAECEAAIAHASVLLDIMRNVAQEFKLWLLGGSLLIRENNKTYNRAPLIAADGRVAFQDKRMRTRFEREEMQLAEGNNPSVFLTPWGIIGIAVCYDVEFPQLVRTQTEKGAWLVLVPTCTETPRGFNRVRLSARARALENQCYVAIAPTVGDAPWSAVLDCNRGYAAAFGPVDTGFPEDGLLSRGAMDEPGLVFVTLDPERLRLAREGGAVSNFADWPPQPPPAPLITLV